MADPKDLFDLNGTNFRITDIFRTDSVKGDPQEYVVEAECCGCTDMRHDKNLELTFTREAAINLMANLMELLNQTGER